jgi:hypothetical protein
VVAFGILIKSGFSLRVEQHAGHERFGDILGEIAKLRPTVGKLRPLPRVSVGSHCIRRFLG